MNWKTMSLFGIGTFLVLFEYLKGAADRQLKVDADTKAVALHNSETKAEIDAAESTIKMADEVSKRENKEYNDRVSSWKKLNNYENRKREAHRAAENELVEFKSSIDYYSKKQAIKDAAEDEFEAYKDSVDYDYEINSREKIVAEAKELYKKKCRLYDIAGNDDSVAEDASAMKAKAKAAMDEACKDAKAEIKEIRSKAEAEKNKINRKMQGELRDLEYELASTKTRLAKQEQEAVSAIEKELSDAKDRIMSEVKAMRSDEEQQALEVYGKCKDRLNDQKIADADTALDIYNNTPDYERMGAYLKSIRCPKWFAGLVAVLPLVPVGYLVSRYCLFVVKTVGAMK